MFEIRQCTQCRLRMPIDPALHRGDFCPRCGAPMTRATEPFQHMQPSTGATQLKRTISILLDNIRSAHNTGAIFRTANGIAAEHLYLCGITPNPTNNPEIQKTALMAETGVPWSAHPDAVALGLSLQAEGICLVALETTPQSQSIFEADLVSLGSHPIVLVVGNEQAGVDPGLLDLCELILSLPMAGSKASLNVAVACGVAAYTLTYL